jgi:hypothetical protein
VPRPSAVHHTTNSLGLADKIDDGRERYMVRTVSACLIQSIVETGSCPTPQELYDAAWSQYERKVDLTRPGRGAEEFAKKVSTRFAASKRQDRRHRND